jgi:hypothetical protein
MAKPNYHQARKQKEVARKARQQEKQQRKAAKVNGDATAAESAASPEPSGQPAVSSENPT